MHFNKKILCIALMLWLATIIASAQTFNVLATFDNSVTGSNPEAPLVQGLDGNFYGATPAGGPHKSCSTGYAGCGVIFKVTPSGVLTPVHWFNGADGGQVYGGLLEDPNGDLYGTASQGGANGDGTVFVITAQGTLRTLHNFSGTDGANPEAGLLLASNLNLYGVTTKGGANNSGTIFDITPQGALNTLYNFCSQSDCLDGGDPVGPLAQASNGNFYGLNSIGGSVPGSSVDSLDGDFFQFSPAGTLTNLFPFIATADVDYAPSSGLMLASNGDFYWETYGDSTDIGTVIGMNSSGGEVLFTVLGGNGNLTGALTEGTDGNFYGVNPFGGDGGEGSVFQITPAGAFTTVFSFNGDGTQGRVPVVPPVQGTDGVFYGTTSSGGSTYYGPGVLYSLSLGLPPFVRTLPANGGVGRWIKILGSNLTGTTSVKFNGTAAAFTVISPTLIQTRVPPGATTGTVEVVTPSGTLKSNIPFQFP